MKVQLDGKIVVGGGWASGGPSSILLVRFNSDGTLDSSFGNNGFVTDQIGDASQVLRHGLALQDDGKIVASGAYATGANNLGFVIRYNPDGTHDSTFGTGGLDSNPLNSSADAFPAVGLQADGKIVLGGNEQTNTLVARLNTDGSVDTSFGNNGSIVTNLGTAANNIQDLALLNDRIPDKITGVGNSCSNYPTCDWALTRYALGTDTTPPVLNVPNTITVNATSSAGARVTYTVTATDPDNQPSDLTIACAPASGSPFPIGTTTVTCTASDPAGNTTTGSFQVVVAPPGKLCMPNPTTIQANFNGTPIPTGDSILFTGILKIQGLPANQTATVFFLNQAITFTANGLTYNTANAGMPAAQVTIDPSATQATTTFDTTTGTWKTVTPPNTAGNIFLSAYVFAPSLFGQTGGLPGGINPVTWTGTIRVQASVPLTVSWQWASAVYTSLSTDDNALGIKPVDDNHASQYQNSDHAGTPENFKPFVTGGARGGGGSNYTGSLSGTASVSCTS